MITRKSFLFCFVFTFQCEYVNCAYSKTKKEKREKSNRSYVFAVKLTMDCIMPLQLGH